MTRPNRKEARAKANELLGRMKTKGWKVTLQEVGPSQDPMPPFSPGYWDYGLWNGPLVLKAWRWSEGDDYKYCCVVTGEDGGSSEYYKNPNKAVSRCIKAAKKRLKTARRNNKADEMVFKEIKAIAAI